MKEETYNLDSEGKLAEIIRDKLEKERETDITIQALSFSARYQELTVDYEEKAFHCNKCQTEIKFGVKECPNCKQEQLWALFG